MKSPLQELEARLEDWIEGSIIRLFGHRIPAASLAKQLAEAMENGLHVTAHGINHAPDNYRITINPETITQLEIPIPELENQLSAGLYNAARDQGYLLGRKPIIILYPETSLTLRDIQVTAWHSTSPLDETHELDTQASQGEPAYPSSAFLIIDGERHFDLDQPVINIGRRHDNQLVLESSLVSRSHAQIRARQGRFILFDLGSKAGTSVHGMPIKQHILQPGDVISMADIRLVYGDEAHTTTDETMGFTPIPHPDPNK